MQHFNFEIQYVTGKENVVAYSLSRRPFVNGVSLVKVLMIDNIYKFDSRDVFSLYSFLEFFSKEYRVRIEIDNYTYVLEREF